MSNKYEKRLKIHQKKITKRLLYSFVIPVAIIVLFLVALSIGQEPDEWETIDAVLYGFDTESIKEGKYSYGQYAVFVSTENRRFVLPMNEDEAKQIFEIGLEYEIVYSRGLIYLYAEGVTCNGEELVSLESSVKRAQRSIGTTRTVCLVLFLISVIATVLVLRFGCKEEIKNIRRIKEKLAKSEDD